MPELLAIHDKGGNIFHPLLFCLFMKKKKVIRYLDDVLDEIDFVEYYDEKIFYKKILKNDKIQNKIKYISDKIDKLDNDFYVINRGKKMEKKIEELKNYVKEKCDGYYYHNRAAFVKIKQNLFHIKDDLIPKDYLFTGDYYDYLFKIPLSALAYITNEISEFEDKIPYSDNMYDYRVYRFLVKYSIYTFGNSNIHDFNYLTHYIIKSVNYQRSRLTIDKFMEIYNEILENEGDYQYYPYFKKNDARILILPFLFLPERYKCYKKKDDFNIFTYNKDIDIYDLLPKELILKRSLEFYEYDKIKDKDLLKKIMEIKINYLIDQELDGICLDHKEEYIKDINNMSENIFYPELLWYEDIFYGNYYYLGKNLYNIVIYNNIDFILGRLSIGDSSLINKINLKDIVHYIKNESLPDEEKNKIMLNYCIKKDYFNLFELKKIRSWLDKQPIFNIVINKCRHYWILHLIFEYNIDPKNLYLLNCERELIITKIIEYDRLDLWKDFNIDAKNYIIKLYENKANKILAYLMSESKN